VFTISRVDESRIRWSNALRRMRIFWPFIAVVSLFRHGPACPGHPRLQKQVVDARQKAGHDDG
jgi:hypothetical protein